MKPQVFPVKKNVQISVQFLNSYLLVPMPSFQFLLCFGGPTLSQHIKGDSTDI